MCVIKYHQFIAQIKKEKKTTQILFAFSLLVLPVDDRRVELQTDRNLTVACMKSHFMVSLRFVCACFWHFTCKTSEPASKQLVQNVLWFNIVWIVCGRSFFFSLSPSFSHFIYVAFYLNDAFAPFRCVSLLSPHFTARYCILCEWVFFFRFHAAALAKWIIVCSVRMTRRKIKTEIKRKICARISNLINEKFKCIRMRTLFAIDVNC